MKSKLSAIALAYAFAVMGCAPRAAAADFYEGKTINLVVGNDAGSGYDSYGRVLGRHMSKYIPGKPNIVVQNMPGAGSITAAQHLYVLAPKDGTSFGLLFPGAIIEPLTGDPAKYRYDPTKFEYLGTADSGTRLCATNGASKVKTFPDARSQSIKLGVTAPGSSTWDYAAFMNVLGGSKFELIAGYKGPADILLAMERGEVEGVCALDSATFGTLRPDWIGSKSVNFLLQAGVEPNKALLDKGIPSMWDFIPDENKPVAELIVSQQVFGRPFVAPPGTPAAQMKILREAFMKAFADPEALAEAARMKIDVNPRDGETVAALVKKVYASPKSLIERMGKAIRP